MLPYITGKILEEAAIIAVSKVKMIEEKPNVSFDIIRSSYKIISYEDKEDILLKLTLLFKNIGKSLTSVTDVVTYIKYDEEILTNKEVFKANVNESLFVKSKRLENPVPLEIGPGVAKQADFNFEFQNVYTSYIYRCLLPVSPLQLCEMFEDKIKWMEWSYKLPIRVFVVGETLTQIIKNEGCIYKENQEESKIIRGTLDYKK